MQIDEIVAVSGLPGLYKIGGSRNNGMIIEDLDTGKSRFASVRKHQFTPLGTVAIYTNTDSTEINTVFETMAEKEGELPIPPHKTASKKELFDYFEAILPDYDRDQVLISDVKKVIKWFSFLRTREIFPFDPPTAEGSEEE